MRIAFLCKRRYMSKDVIVDRYARLYEIPFQLARLGHDVRGWCLSYGKAEQGAWEHDAAPGRLHWESRSLGRWKLPTLLGYRRHLLRQLRGFSPDVIIGASDIPHVVLGARLARQLHVPFVADLYDNFEGFGQARIPGFVPALRRVVRGADLVLTTSEPLRELVIDSYKARGEVIAMPSSVDTSVFHPRDRIASRRALGLPEDARLIGTAGGLYRDKGIAALYDAWRLLEGEMADLHLVLAGPHEASLPPPQGERVHSLGPLPHARVAELFASLDVGVMCIIDTPFGRYCFPQKAYEMLACNLPVVAADVGAMGRLFADTPQCLYAAGDAADLAQKLRLQLQAPVAARVPIDDWATLLAAVEPKLRKLTETSRIVTSSTGR
jgi:glycosyltransferase involved in cell wall biosynthesis